MNFDTNSNARAMFLVAKHLMFHGCERYTAFSVINSEECCEAFARIWAEFGDHERITNIMRELPAELQDEIRDSVRLFCEVCRYDLPESLTQIEKIK